MKQRGFILVATLWILAAITIAAAFFAERIATSIALANQYDAHIQTQIACSDTKAEVAYLLGTRSLGAFGIGDRNVHISLDSHPYQMAGDCIARLQDARGLLPINSTTRDALGVLLHQKDVPEADIDKLSDTLLDYVDPTPGIHRLNGVASSEYKNHGLPEPTGFPLVTPDQLRQVYGWKEQKSLWTGSEPITDWITTAKTAGLNPNTALPQVLLTLPGVTPELLPRILQYRAIEPIQESAQLATLLGVDWQSVMLSVLPYPADKIRVSLGSDSQSSSIRYNISLTPIADDAPWRIDYYYPVPQRIIQTDNVAISPNPFDLKATPSITSANLPFFESPPNQAR